MDSHRPSRFFIINIQKSHYTTICNNVLKFHFHRKIILETDQKVSFNYICIYNARLIFNRYFLLNVEYPGFTLIKEI